MESADTDSAIEALCILGEARAAGVILHRTKDGHIAWRGGDQLAEGLQDSISKHKPALVQLLSHHAIRLEQAALYEMDVNELLLDEAFGRTVSSMGMTGGIEYGRAVAHRSKPN